MHLYWQNVYLCINTLDVSHLFLINIKTINKKFSSLYTVVYNDLFHSLCMYNSSAQQ